MGIQRVLVVDDDLTARTSDAEVWAGWAAGADYYPTEPFDVSQLLDFIAGLGSEGSSEDATETARVLGA